MTDLGCSLVLQLRARHPELAAGPVDNCWNPLVVEGLGTIPAPRWKEWADWNEKAAA
jgi:hypothetical protein